MLPPRSPRTASATATAALLLALVALLAVVPAAPAAATTGDPAPAPAPRPLGTVTDGVPDGCPDGYDCTGIVVTGCPGVVAPLAATYGVARPDGPARGVAVFLSGSGGREWFGVGSAGVNAGGRAMKDLVRAGFVVAQLRWADPGWLTAGTGDDQGADGLACRPATALRHLHDTLYAPLGLAEAATGACGFCVVGVSGGASAIAYAVTAYGRGDAVDVAVLASGPPHASIDRGCLGELGYSYAPSGRNTIDRSYGWAEADGAGPCRAGDPGMATTWAADSAGGPGADLVLPTTRVELVLGAQDDPAIWAHGRDFTRALAEAGTPAVAEQVVAGAGHAVYNDVAAMDAIVAELLAAGGDPEPDPDPDPEPDPDPVPAGPSVVVRSPAPVSYEAGQHVVADYECLPGDGAAPVASCTGTVAAGEPVDTSAPGSYDVTVTAVDADGATATATVTYQVRSTGPSVLLVTGRTPLVAADRRIQERLVSTFGAVVTVRDDAAPVDVADHDVVVVSDSVDPAVLAAGYRDVAVGLVALDPATWDDLGLSARAGSTAPAAVLAVEESGHPLTPTASTRRSLTVTSDPAPLAWVDEDHLGAGGVPVLTMARTNDRVVDVGYDAGTMLSSGRLAAGRRVALGFTAGAVPDLTPTGWGVVEAAVTWAAGR